MRSSGLGLIASAFVAFALVGCGGGGPDVDTSGVDVDELLAAAADRMDAVTSFHFDLEHDNGTATIVRGLEMVSAEGDVEVHLFAVTAAGAPILSSAYVSRDGLPDANMEPTMAATTVSTWGAWAIWIRASGPVSSWQLGGIRPVSIFSAAAGEVTTTHMGFAISASSTKGPTLEWAERPTARQFSPNSANTRIVAWPMLPVAPSTATAVFEGALCTEFASIEMV